jgi:hypothetical protein
MDKEMTIYRYVGQEVEKVASRRTAKIGLKGKIILRRRMT